VPFTVGLDPRAEPRARVGSRRCVGVAESHQADRLSALARIARPPCGRSRVCGDSWGSPEIGWCAASEPGTGLEPTL